MTRSSRCCDWAHGRGFGLTLIEGMPLGEVGIDRVDSYLPLRELRERLKARFTLEPADHRTGGPARYDFVKETDGLLGFITPMSHNFCESCNRVRLTATGQLYMCLGQEDMVDLRAALREGGADALDAALDRAMQLKPKGHDFVLDRGAPVLAVSPPHERDGRVKTLLVVNGAMGVGKSAVCRALLGKLQPAAWVDGDWGWMVSPFEVTEANLALVHKNIRNLLLGYLEHPKVETVILSWVLHRPGMIDDLLRPIAFTGYRLKQATLTLTPGELTERLQRDIAAGLREPDILERALLRLAECARLDTPKIDAARPIPEIVADIVELIS